MKRSLKLLTVVAALAFPSFVIAATPNPTPPISTSVGTGIAGTDHDFSTIDAKYSGTETFKTGSQSAYVYGTGTCSYCHTPHTASATTLLWNHKLSANTFSWDDTATAGGTTYATIAPTYKGPSVKCLSCHDGSVAIGDVYAFQQKSYAAGNNVVFNTFAITNTNKLIGAGGSLSGQHPVAMPYPYGNAASTYNGVTTGANVNLNEFQGNPEGTNGTHIKLYNSAAGAAGAAVTAGGKPGLSGIECSTCHDPHNKSAVDKWLLRGKLFGSSAGDGYICLQCHVK